MRKIISILILLAAFCSIWGSTPVNIRIADGIEDGGMKTKMENLMSTLFTEAGVAQEMKRELNLSALRLADDVQSSLAMLWDNSPFVCMDTEVVQHCISTPTGYQIRNIPLQLTEAPDDDKYQEAVINFDKLGNMTSFHLSISMNLYMNIINSKMKVTDLRRRQLILDYVEQFRTAYNQKNKEFLEAIFSEDALIITGKVIKRQTREGIRLPDKIEYTKHTKKQYLDKLSAIFAANKKIRVTFDEIEVMLHPIDADVYGVTLHQGYTSDNYHDDGYLFLLWDFRDETHPKIHVRTWQPDAYNKDGKGTQRIARSEIFSLNDFDIE